MTYTAGRYGDVLAYRITCNEFDAEQAGKPSAFPVPDRAAGSVPDDAKATGWAGGRPGGAAVDPKQTVADGYDRVAERYVEWSRDGGDPRDGFVAFLEARLPAGAAVLELGCGTGALTTARLAQRFAATGVDISGRSIELARRNVPGAAFRHADMAAVRFPDASFDAVTAFYSIIHVPREEHAPLLRRIAGWLRPGGLLVATMGAADSPGEVEQNWLGAPMYFSHHDAETNRRLVRDAGLRLLSAHEETAEEDGVPVTFLWVVAEKLRGDESGDEGVVETAGNDVRGGGLP
jgi:SAM-dependent methyltransferase